MTPEAAESFMNSHRPPKASMEKPVHVSGQLPHAIYPKRQKIPTHHEKFRVNTVPIRPNCSFETKSQVTSRWTTRHTAETMTMIEFLSWHCKNRWRGKRKTKEKCSGMNHIDTCPACTASSGGCPMSIRMGVAKK